MKKKMGKVFEEEKRKKNCMESLEEKISAFYVEEFDETHRLDDDEDDDDDDDDDDDEDGSDDRRRKTKLHSDPSTERVLFWESQEALLQEIMERQSLTGQKLRQEVQKIVELAREAEFCNCIPKTSSDGFCTFCFRRMLVNKLREKGFNANLCTSKWKRTKEIPGGTHEYIEVMTIAPGRKQQLPFLVELEFRDQFEIAKACDEYRKLVSQLPAYYIGKPEYLNTIVRILCNAAKQSMKEKKIYMGPWRKRSFMEMKWSRSLGRKQTLGESRTKVLSVSPRKSYQSRLHLSTAPIAVVT